MNRRIITNNSSRTVVKKSNLEDQLRMAMEKQDFSRAEKILDKMDLASGLSPADLEIKKEVIKELAKGPFLPRQQFEQLFDQLFKMRKGQKEMEKYASKGVISKPSKPHYFPPGVPPTGTKPFDAVKLYEQAKNDFQSTQKKEEEFFKKVMPYMGGQAVTGNAYHPWKPGNTPTVADMNAMLQLLGGGPLNKVPETLLASQKTFEKLKAHFGPEVAEDLGKMHGIKVQVVPGMEEDKLIAMSSAAFTALGKENFFGKTHEDFQKYYMNEWLPPKEEDNKK